MRGADFSNANLQMSLLSQTKVEGASFHKALVHGISTWNLEGTPTDQSGLVFTGDHEAQVTVEDLKLAQFVYLYSLYREIANYAYSENIFLRVQRSIGYVLDNRMAMG